MNRDVFEVATQISTTVYNKIFTAQQAGITWRHSERTGAKVQNDYTVFRNQVPSLAIMVLWVLVQGTPQRQARAYCRFARAE